MPTVDGFRGNVACRLALEDVGDASYLIDGYVGVSARD